MTKRGNKKSFHIITVFKRCSIARSSRNDESSEKERDKSGEWSYDKKLSRKYINNQNASPFRVYSLSKNYIEE